MKTSIDSVFERAYSQANSKFEEHQKSMERKPPEKKTLEKSQPKGKSKLQEAFRSGMSGKMIPKICSVLSKKLGYPVKAGPMAVAYQNGMGKFLSYLGMMPKGELRFNFLLSSSDVLYSVDIYNEDDPPFKPTFTVMLNGYNIVQIIDQLADVITGEFFQYDDEVLYAEAAKEEADKKLSEAARVTLASIMESWMSITPWVSQQLGSSSPDYEKLLEEFNKYLISLKYRKQVKKVSILQIIIKEVLKSPSGVLAGTGAGNISPNKIPAVSVVPAQKDRTTLVDASIRDLFEEALHPTAQEIYDDMIDVTNAIAHGDPSFTGMIVYGPPGVGKTFMVEKIMRDEGANFTTFQASVGGFTGLLGRLYQHCKDEVLIFDDNDDVWQNSKCIDIMKHILQKKPVRVVGTGLPVPVKGVTDPSNDNKTLVVPDFFDFSSKCIFITNRDNIDPAIISRLRDVSFRLEFSKEEILGLIKKSISEIEVITDQPELVTEDLRWEVFELAEKVLGGIDRIDFRAFQSCLQWRLGALVNNEPETKWKKKCIRILLGS